MHVRARVHACYICIMHAFLHACSGENRSCALRPARLEDRQRLSVKTFKRNLFLKPNFLQSFGVKRQMAVFGQCRFPRLGQQEMGKTRKCRGTENTAALNSNKQPPSMQLPQALRATRAAECRFWASNCVLVVKIAREPGSFW